MKRFLPILLVLCMISGAAFADPLALLDDYFDEIIQPIDEADPSAGEFVYSYRYPHVDEEAEGGAEINAFYEDQIVLSEFESHAAWIMRVRSDDAFLKTYESVDKLEYRSRRI